MKTLAAVLLLAAAALSLGCPAMAPRRVANTMTPGSSTLILPGIVCSVATKLVLEGTPVGVVFEMAEIGSERSIEDVCANAIRVLVPMIRERECAQAMGLVAGQRVSVSGTASIRGITARSLTPGDR